MLPYNASDMIRAMRQDHGLTADNEANAPARDARRRGGASFTWSRFDRWIGVVAHFLVHKESCRRHPAAPPVLLKR